MSEKDKPVSYTPTDGLTYDPSEAKYWDAGALRKEITRTFEICHGCRRCFKFCDVFVDLFSLIDNEHDGDVRKISPAQTDRILSGCFQCKLCEIECPYTVRDGHEYKLDFPKLVHRHQAQRVRKEGLSLQEKMLGDPDRAARLARSSLGVANVMNRVAAHRWFLEKSLGIHRDKLLPDFAGKTFESWAAASGLIAKEPGGEVVLFQTCFVQHNQPELGRDTVEVMRKNQVDIRCAKGLECCGMPAWEHGDLDSLRRHARRNLDVLLPFVEKGAKVMAINPTCSMMLRMEYPGLLEGADRERAVRLAAAVTDPSEFLWSIREQERFNTDFKSTPGPTVAYHAPCHLRAQNVGFKGRDLLRKIPGVTPRMVMECCGHNGTFAMKIGGFETSQRVGKRAFDGMKSAEAEVWSTDCPLAALQFAQHAGKRPLHPMRVLARAYREDGFPTRLPEKEPDQQPEAGPEQ